MNPDDCKCDGEHCSDPSCRSKARSFGPVAEYERIFPAPVKALGMTPPRPFGEPPEPGDVAEESSIRRTFL